MYQNDVIKNILAYNKAGFENAYNSLVYIHNQAEVFIEQTLAGNAYIPKEGKDMVKNWIRLSKETRDIAKRAVSQEQEKMEAFIAPESP